MYTLIYYCVYAGIPAHLYTAVCMQVYRHIYTLLCVGRYTGTFIHCLISSHIFHSDVFFHHLSDPLEGPTLNN
jgi:hypothetical protein